MAVLTFYIKTFVKRISRHATRTAAHRHVIVDLALRVEAAHIATRINAFVPRARLCGRAVRT